MKGTTQQLIVVQNIGLMDRVLRIAIGALMLGGATYSLASGSVVSWEAFAIALSVYPFLTAILGWDPVYGAMDTRTCRIDGKGRNQCGTFPYEVDAALGHKLVPDKEFEYDHSLTACHHEPTRQAA